jgi:hypothetical protein
MPDTPVRDRNTLRSLRAAGTEFVFWRDAAHELRFLELAPGNELLIGRGGDNDIVFAHDAVSKRHASIAYGAHGGWLITDRGSTNGTFVMSGTTDDDPVGALASFVRLEPGVSKPFVELHTLVRLGRRGPCFHVQLADGGGDTITESEVMGPRVLHRLTARQLDVLIALARPKFSDPHRRTTPNKELGDEVGLAVEGVKTAIVALRTLFGAEDRESLAALAIQEGLAEVAAARER